MQFPPYAAIETIYEIILQLRTTMKVFTIVLEGCTDTNTKRDSKTTQASFDRFVALERRLYQYLVDKLSST